MYCLVLSCCGLSLKSCLILSWPALTWLDLTWLALTWLGLACIVLSCLVLSCLLLSCRVLYALVLSCLILYVLVISDLTLSCLVLPSIHLGTTETPNHLNLRTTEPANHQSSEPQNHRTTKPPNQCFLESQDTILFLMRCDGSQGGCGIHVCLQGGVCPQAKRGVLSNSALCFNWKFHSSVTWQKTTTLWPFWERQSLSVSSISRAADGGFSPAWGRLAMVRKRLGDVV